MRALLPLLLLFAVPGAGAASTWAGPKCRVERGMFVLSFGWTKVPTYAGVIVPDGRMLQLRYGPGGVDTLGAGYDKGKVRMPVGDLAGVNEQHRRERVFVAPGRYRFVMQDANTADGMALHRVRCDIFLAER